MKGNPEHASPSDDLNSGGDSGRRSLILYTGRMVLLFFAAVALALETVEHLDDHHQWIVALAVAALFVARGIRLGRPVRAKHAAGCATLVVSSAVAYRTGYADVGLPLLAPSGLALMWPMTSRPQPELLPEVYDLVDRTTGDPLAPFAMHAFKSYFFSENQAAVLAYHSRVGVAVVSGDPIGDSDCFPSLIEQFRQHCANRGWRIAVLAASERHRALWTSPGAAPKFCSVAIGRDVVLRVDSFDMAGRQFRNLRQAVNRTYNAGLTTEVIPERELTVELRAELIQIAKRVHGRNTERGFSMILDHLLDGRYPGILIVIARGKDGEVQGFARHAVAGNGTEISLDMAWRRERSPNGIDERLGVAMLEYARDHGGRRVSLAFAAFPELFEEENRGWVGRVVYRLIHLGDPVLALESLYRYLRKFHALDERRYVLLDFKMLPIAAFALLTLEFVPRRKNTYLTRL